METIQEKFQVTSKPSLIGFYLGFIVSGRSPKWLKATSFLGGIRGHAPRKVFEMNMRWDAIWCILRHNFEKWYSVCTDLVASGWFFRYSYLYIVMITIFFWRKLGILGGGGSFYPSNTLDRTLLKKRLCELAVSSALRKAKDVNQS